MNIEVIQELYRRHVERHPRDHFAVDLWARFLLSVNRAEDVICSIGPIQHQQPDRRGLRLHLAQAHAFLNQPDRAAAMLLGGSKKQGYSAVSGATGILGALVSNGQLDEARGFAEALAGRMRWLDYRWRVSAARDRLNDMVNLNRRAAELFQSDQLLRAKELYQNMTRMQPDYPTAFYFLAVIEKKAGHLDKSKGYLQQALSLWSPARSAFHAGLWETTFGEPALAMDYFNAAAGLAGDDQELTRNLASIFSSGKGRHSSHQDLPRPLNDFR